MTGKAVIAAYVDAFNSGDLDRLCGCFTPDAQVWGVLGWGGLDAVRPIWRALIEGLEINLEILSCIEEGNIVAARYLERGRSAKEFMGFEATGRRYELIAMEWFELSGSRIRRRWGARDSASMYQQLGFVAQPTAPRPGAARAAASS